MVYFFLEKFYLSSTCFGCYLHPSSEAQLQCTAIGFYLWKAEVLVSSGVEVYFMDLCVFVVLISCDIDVLVCVIGYVFVLRGFDMWFLCAVFVYLRFWCVLFHRAGTGVGKL
jgi:hypothetical protein